MNVELVEGMRRAHYRDVLAALERVELVRGRARLAGPRELLVESTRHRAGRILLAPGARPARPPIPGLEDTAVWDSTSAMEATTLPSRLLVLGGRYVALELGQLFACLGSRVTLLERSDAVLPDEDADVRGALAAHLQEEGLELLPERQVTRVSRKDSGFLVEARHAGALEHQRGDAVLLRRVATGGGRGARVMPAPSVALRPPGRRRGARGASRWRRGPDRS